MVFVLPGSLSKVDEAVVRKLFKVVHATKYEDPVDQDTFLIESANTVLQFHPQVASFVLIPELGECVFSIRAMMHASSAQLGTPFSDTFVSIQDFAGEILRKHQTFRERKHANADPCLKLDAKPPVSPDKDAVSIPSSSDESGADEPPRDPKNPLSSPIKVDPSQAQPSSQVNSGFVWAGCRWEHFCTPPSVLFIFPLVELVLNPFLYPVQLSIITKPIPTGPRARLHPKPAPTSRKRWQVEAGEDSSSPAADLPYARPSRPMPHPAAGSASSRPATAVSEDQLRRRLAAVQAEMCRLASAQKELYWQLQVFCQSKPVDLLSVPQEG
ncbi:hypothetical protein B0H10DRAFT_2208764 [Mycena sp. CBHHK59/15]|nr:hypothetical protein B0H10DRAFT_2208764 [Mycena sp. CBHHK59/15]